MDFSDDFDAQFDLDFTMIQQTARPKNLRSKSSIPPNFHKDAPFFIRHLLYRRHRRMNSIILVCGQVRTGKSWLSLKLAEQYSKYVDKKFVVDEQCSFGLIKFLKWSAENSDSVHVLEEVGQSLPSTDWHSLQSKIFRNFTQTQGYRGNVLIMTLPDPSSLVKTVKNQINYLIVTTNQGSAIIYRMRMDYFREKLKPTRMGRIRSRKPRKTTTDAYEEMKRKWNENQLKKDIDHLLRVDEKKKQEIDEFYVPKGAIAPILTIPKNYL